MKIATYDTDLTDAQWAYLKPMLPKPAKRGRPPRDRRRIIDAILYLVKCGCPLRYLPTDFPHWKTVYHVFRRWVHNHRRLRDASTRQGRLALRYVPSGCSAFRGCDGPCREAGAPRVRRAERVLGAPMRAGYPAGCWAGEGWGRAVALAAAVASTACIAMASA